MILFPLLQVAMYAGGLIARQGRKAPCEPQAMHEAHRLTHALNRRIGQKELG